jgi:hypothetical protein
MIGEVKLNELPVSVEYKANEIPADRSDIEIHRVLLGGKDITKALELIGYDFDIIADDLVEQINN